MKLVTLYRKLLILYPRGFREEFGEEMVTFFEDRAREAGRSGRLGLVLACAKALVDLGASAWAERREAWARGRARRSRSRRRRKRRRGMLHGFDSDVRSALRAIAKRPGLSTTAVATLALGLGAASVIFAVVNAVLLRPLPYADPEHIVTIWNRYGEHEVYSSPPDYLDRRERATSFERLAAVAPTTMNLSGEIEPRHVDVARVTSEFFDVFGVGDVDGTPVRFPDETGGEPKRLAVLAHGLWQGAFGGAPNVRGRTVTLNGEPYEIIGVLPERVDFPRGTQIYVPLGFDPEDQADENRGNEYLLNVGRLEGGVSLETARAEMEAIAASVLERVPERRRFLERNGWGAVVVPLHEHLTENVRPALSVLAAAVILVLIVAGANVANMLLVSLSGRGRELAVRASLGASRGRLVRQVALESLVLSGLGAIFGVLVSTAVLAVLPVAIPQDVPRLDEAGLDASVFAAVALLAVVTGVLTGIVPAWQASSGRLHAALRAGTSEARSSLRRVLVAGEVALAVTLLVAAGLLVRSFETLTRLDPGFAAENRLTLRLRLPSSQFPERSERIVFQNQLLERLRAIPGVRSAAVSDRIPLDGSGWTGTFHPVGYEPAPGEPTPGGELNLVSPGYFETLGIPVHQGREFSHSDAPDTAPVVIVDAWAAERYWPEGAVGERINMNPPGETPRYREIVGVVGHVKLGALDEPGRVQVYFPSTQLGGRRLGITLHVEAPTEQTVSRARAEVARLAPGLPVYGVRALEDLVSDSLAFREFQMALLSAFAALTLLLASVGLYGVLAYSVSRRRLEMGVRIAMGARSRSIAMLVLREALLLVAVGLGVGALLALSMSRFFERLLFGVQPTDPATLAAVGALLLSVSALAAWLPAHRATRVDPVEALRC